MLRRRLIAPTLALLLAPVAMAVLAAPATPETVHVIGERTVRQLKRGVHLVNIARGKLIVWGRQPWKALALRSLVPDV